MRYNYLPMTERHLPQTDAYPGAIILSEAVLDPNAGRTPEERAMELGQIVRAAADRDSHKFKEGNKAYARNPVGEDLTFEFSRNGDVIIRVGPQSRPDDIYAISRDGQQHLYLPSSSNRERRSLGREDLDGLVSHVRGAKLIDIS